MPAKIKRKRRRPPEIRIPREQAERRLKKLWWWRDNPPEGTRFVIPEKKRDFLKTKGKDVPFTLRATSLRGHLWIGESQPAARVYELIRRADEFGSVDFVLSRDADPGYKELLQRSLRELPLFPYLSPEVVAILSPERNLSAPFLLGSRRVMPLKRDVPVPLHGLVNLAYPNETILAAINKILGMERAMRGLDKPSRTLKGTARRPFSWRTIEIMDLARLGVTPALDRVETSIFCKARDEASRLYRLFLPKFEQLIRPKLLRLLDPRYEDITMDHLGDDLYD